MLARNSRTEGGILLIVGIACFLSVAAFLTPAAGASELPPRPTVPVLTMPGGYIELRIPANQLTLWTVVQWQDSLGGWHTVDGWQGTLDSISSGVGIKTWWVAPDDFGKGPFRWVVYQSMAGQVLATSDSFYLPKSSRRTVVVEASQLQ